MNNVVAPKKLAVLIASLTLALVGGSPVISEDWSGFLLGASVGRHNAEGNSTSAQDMRVPGLHFGYDLDFGQLVLGGEVEVEQAQIQIGTTETQEMQRIKFRAGFDFGQTLGYVTLGGVRAETDQDHGTGAVVGLGLSYSLNQNMQLGGEVLYQDIDGLGPSGLRRSNSFSLRASFRF